MASSRQRLATCLFAAAGVLATARAQADDDEPDTLMTVVFASLYGAAFATDVGLLGNDIAKAARGELFASDYGVAELAVAVPQSAVFHGLLLGGLGLDESNVLPASLHLPATLSTILVAHGSFYADAETPYSGPPGKPMVISYLVGSAVPGIAGGIGYAAHGLPSAKWFATTQMVVNFPALLVGAYHVATERDDAVEYGAAMSLNAVSFLHGAASIIADTVLDLDGPSRQPDDEAEPDAPAAASLRVVPAGVGERGAPGLLFVGAF